MSLLCLKELNFEFIEIAFWYENTQGWVFPFDEYVFVCSLSWAYFYIDCTLFQEGLKINNNETRYKKLLEVYKTAHSDLAKQVVFKKARKEWNRVKGSPEDYESLLNSLKARAAKRKSVKLKWPTKASSTKSRKGKSNFVGILFISFARRAWPKRLNKNVFLEILQNLYSLFFLQSNILIKRNFGTEIFMFRIHTTWTS